jgi:hypothetical protein
MASCLRHLTTPPATLFWHHDGETLFRLTKYGLAEPSVILITPRTCLYDGILTDADIIAVLSYTKSTWPQDIRDRHDAMESQR